MQLKLFRQMWCAPTDVDTLVKQTVAGGFDGIEGPIPANAQARQALKRRLDEAGLLFIAECTTGLPEQGGADDWWVPDANKGPQDHAADLRWTAERVPEMEALFITTMCGYDAWAWPEQLRFFEAVLQLEQETGVSISCETHRCRSMFNPWLTASLLEQFPQLKVTCDFSHWCAVAERVIDSEIAIIQQCAEQAFHVHGRVGEPQRAQVADPRAPEAQKALTSHEQWWDMIWADQAQRGWPYTTMTMEWGCDGYTPLLPYTQAPVVDLWEITCWMAERERQRFNHQFAVS
jgi:sugar phosphate isomerase/epimerase